MKVLIALDGSTVSEQALELAQELLAGTSAEVTVLHVIPRHLIYGKGGPVVAECYDPEEEQAISRTLLEGAATRLSAAGVGSAITKEIEVGDPADAILTVAADEGIDLIIMGSRGLNAAKRFLLGSVSTKVSTHAPCAVLVAHPKVETEKVASESEQTLATATI